MPTPNVIIIIYAFPTLLSTNAVMAPAIPTKTPEAKESTIIGVIDLKTVDKACMLRSKANPVKKPSMKPYFAPDVALTLPVHVSIKVSKSPVIKFEAIIAQ